MPAGVHELAIPVWRPVGTPAQEMSAFFLEAHPVLRAPSSVVYSAAASERCRLVTAGTGTVHVACELLFRHMEAYGVEW